MSDKFLLLKKLLKALGLSEERVEELIARIETWLQDDREAAGTAEEDEPQAQRYPYRLRDDFLSPAEHRFFQVLLRAVTPWAVVCPKVRLGDIFLAQTPDRSAWLRARNRIEQKHVDFLLCDPQSMRPLLAVELNDRSHERADRKKRDRFVLGVFDAVSLPLVGIRVQGQYDVAELARFLRAKARTAQGPVGGTNVTEGPVVERARVGEAPWCPKCGALDGSRRRSADSFSNGTLGTSTLMSMRCISGPDTFFW